jgi:phenylalanyl-tRNA synthetase beta chain
MKFALSTLKQYLDTSASLQEICQTLTKIGLEVESVIDKASDLKYFTVAKIIEAKPHPNSAKLKICLVETSLQKDPLQIICGASNARDGIKVAFAPINSIIPNNLMQIKLAKIAGVESNGMLCSFKELNLGFDAEGIIEIDEIHPIGKKISEVFNVDEAIIELNITPNRGDCLGVYGVALDLSATGIGKLIPFTIEKSKSTFLSNISVNNLAKNDCSQICFREIKNLKNLQSPLWLKEKLENAGFSSISAVVDAVNYVSHILNRPMHAYDLNKIGKSITIQNNPAVKNFITLKNTSHQISENILTISDENKIISIAGVMGSLDSSCDENTTNILLESANFSKEKIAFSGRSLNIISDSRHRFERGVDPNSCLDGIELTTKIILDICGGEVSEIIIDGTNLELKTINFDFSKIKKLTGLDISKELAIKILSSLNFVVKENFTIQVPSSRHDISSSEDLVEEILRIYGYENIIKTTLDNYPNQSINYNIINLDKIRFLLASKGMHETISWSFIDEKIISYFSAISPNLILQNPISQDLNHLRPNLVIGLLNSYQKNYLRNNQDISLFEIGNIFIDEKTEKLMVSGLRAGKNLEQNHYNDQRDFDFFDVKKDFFDIVDLFDIKPDSLQISTDNLPKYYHPHRSATLKLGKKIIGYIGELNPQINKLFDLKPRINIFEIFFDELPKNDKSINRKAFITNDFPIVERDFAFLVNIDCQVGEILSSIISLDKNLIKDVKIFDIYSGKSIDLNKKSIAIRVKIQSAEKTLNSEEIDQIANKIINQLSSKFSAIIRS